MNYVGHKRSRWLSKLSAWCKRNVIVIAIQDCTCSYTVKFALGSSGTVINMLKNVECLNYAKLKTKTKLQKHHIDVRLKIRILHCLKTLFMAQISFYY